MDELVRQLLRYKSVEETVRSALRAVEGEELWTGSLRRDKIDTRDVDETKAVTDGYVVMPVWFATNRERHDNGETPAVYTGNRGELGFGRADVSIPANHKVAQLEGPSWWEWRAVHDPRKHIVLLDTVVHDRAAFTARLAEKVGKSQSRSVLLFVHGFNVRFEDAARRAAQLAYDLRFPGPALLFSWPSRGEVKQYMVDAATCEWSIPHCLECLRIATQDVGAETVHAIAHSMGARLLVNVAGRPTSGLAWTRLRQIILAAADIDAGVFRQLASSLKTGAQGDPVGPGV